MDTLEWIATITSIVGFLVLIATLRYLAAQTKQLVNSLEASATAATMSNLATVSSLMHSNPLIRLLFYEDEAAEAGLPVPSPTGEERLRANIVAELMLDQIDIMLHMRDRGLTWPTEIFGVWGLYGPLVQSRFLRDYVAKRAAWYHPEMVSAAAETE